MIEKSFGFFGLFLTLAISAYAGGTYGGNLVNSNEGYSKIDVTGDKRPENIFLRKGKVKGTVVKLVITNRASRN